MVIETLLYRHGTYPNSYTNCKGKHFVNAQDINEYVISMAITGANTGATTYRTSNAARKIDVNALCCFVSASCDT